MKIERVSTYNARRNSEWHVDMTAWRMGESAMPHLPMYIFQTPEGTARKRGYVVTNGDSARFFLTKQKMMEYTDGQAVNV